MVSIRSERVVTGGCRYWSRYYLCRVTRSTRGMPGFVTMMHPTVSYKIHRREVVMVREW